MKKKEKLEVALVKARANWRRTCDSAGATAAERRKALVVWKKAREERDRALEIWRRELAERRRTSADRRKAQADSDWLKRNNDQRKLPRRR